MITGLLAAQLLAAHITPTTCTAKATAPSLDHVVTVVRDLDAGAAEFRRLGFKTKAGRLHANNLLNRHIKFRDGTEIELMTVQGPPGDGMAQRYADLLKAGEGGVYVALKASDIADVQRVASNQGLSTHRSSSGAWQFLGFPATSPAAAVFFSSGDFTVQDPDSVVAHTPAVSGLIEAWIEGSADVGTLLEQLGAARCERVRAPDGRAGERFALSRGSIVLVTPWPASRPRVLGVVLASPEPKRATNHPLNGFWIAYRRD